MKPLHANMKMADLIEVNYHLLAVLTRFGIEGGFGEKTVRDILTQKSAGQLCFTVTPRKHP